MKDALATPASNHLEVAQGTIIDRCPPGKQSHVRIPQSKRKIIIALFMACAVIASSAQLLLLQSQKDSGPPLVPARISMTPHDPISISGNAGFLESSSGVRSGNGTPADPYIISDWEIDASNSTGIYVSGTNAYFVIRNVTINATAQQNDGILLEGVSNAQIRNVTIWNCHTGIVVWSVSSSIAIDSSSVSKSWDYGIVTEFGATSYIDITRNRVYDNDATGINLGSASHFNVISNNVSTDEISSSSRRALGLIGSSNGIVTGNNLTAQYKSALYASTCQSVIVANNSIASVFTFGIYLTSCTGFSICGNSFMGKPQSNEGYQSQAYDDGGSENAWNSSYPTGGNYWVDYSGTDVMSGPNQDIPGSDGIGDTPYNIDSNSMDRYPLVNSTSIEPIPEFPTLVLPLISVLALLFMVIGRRLGREF